MTLRHTTEPTRSLGSGDTKEERMDDKYSPYCELEAVGGRIGLMTCKRCGAVVMIESGGNAAELHDEWHKRLDRDSRALDPHRVIGGARNGL